MHAAGDDAGVDPDRISFTRSLRAARRSVRTQRGTAPLHLARALISVS